MTARMQAVFVAAVLAAATASLTISTWQQAYQAGGACLAHHMHHRDCPQHVNNSSASQFVAHHRWPTGKGGSDEPFNLLWLWNGTGRLGAGGCHQQIHTFSRLARVLGLLRFHSDDHLFGIGVTRAINLNYLTRNELTEAGYTP